jgi:hypothetical protein
MKRTNEDEEKTMDPLKPTPQLLVKLGSLIVHADEFLSPGGHQFDKDVFIFGLADPEVNAWLDAMTAKAFLPRKRQPHEAAMSMVKKGKAKS